MQLSTYFQYYYDKIVSLYRRSELNISESQTLNWRETTDHSRGADINQLKLCSLEHNFHANIWSGAATITTAMTARLCKIYHKLGYKAKWTLILISPLEWFKWIIQLTWWLSLFLLAPKDGGLIQKTYAKKWLSCQEI